MDQIDDDLEFIKVCNTGGEFMSQDKIDRLKQLQQKHGNCTVKHYPL